MLPCPLSQRERVRVRVLGTRGRRICIPLWSPAGTGPELLGRQRCALRQSLELGPHDGVMHTGRKGTLGEATISAGNHVLPPDQPSIGCDAPGDEFRMLDEVSRMGTHAGDNALAVRELDIFPDLPPLLMARISRFHTVSINAP